MTIAAWTAKTKGGFHMNVPNASQYFQPKVLRSGPGIQPARPACQGSIQNQEARGNWRFGLTIIGCVLGVMMVIWVIKHLVHLLRIGGYVLGVLVVLAMAVGFFKSLFRS